MAQNIVKVAGTNDEQEIAQRLVEKFEREAGDFGVGFSDELRDGLTQFIADVVEEERDEAEYDEDANGLTADVMKNMAHAMLKFADNIDQGEF